MVEGTMERIDFTPEDSAIFYELRATIWDLLRTIPEDSARVLVCRFGLDGKGKRTQRETADECWQRSEATWGAKGNNV